MFKRQLQAIALLAYRLARSSGLLSTALGNGLFQKSYLIYKRRFEATDTDSLRQFVAPSTDVIDVGAHVGYFTMWFGRWVSGTGEVLAIEAEPKNYEQLCRNVVRAKLGPVVRCVHAAAANADGTVMLAVNQDNPADNWVATTGITVPARKIDTLMEERDWPRVSLLKIDVQGGECAVLEGAAVTIARFQPAIYLEIDEAALSRAGHSADSLVDMLASMGYRIYGIDKGEVHGPLTKQTAAKIRSAMGYADFLFLPERRALAQAGRT